MKRAVKMSLMVVAWLILSQVAAIGSDEILKGSPVTEVVNPEFQFETTVEGTKLAHDFIFKNTGTALLEIQEVKTG